MSREIVIVDDHEAVRDALLGMVEEAGYEAVAFSNATAALVRIGEHRPALVRLDMMMPDVDAPTSWCGCRARVMRPRCRSSWYPRSDTY